MTARYSEDSLILGVKNSSEEIVKYLYSNNYPKAVKLVTEKSDLKDDVSDLFHESLITLIENVRHNKFKGNSKLETYLMSIVKFKFYELLRQNKKQLTYEVSDEIRIAEGVTEDHSTNKSMQLMKQLDNISKDCKQLLTKFYYENLNMKEIASHMNYTDSFVRVKKTRCMKKLKDAFLKSNYKP